MKEAEIRKYHRWIGIILSLFIVIQVGSGVIISLSSILESDVKAHDKGELMDESSQAKSFSLGNSTTHAGSLMSFIHHDGGAVLQIIRILTGLGIIGMAFSGTIIFIKVNKRGKNLLTIRNGKS